MKSMNQVEQVLLTAELASDSVLVNSSSSLYVGVSNENLKSAIKIRNTARLSCKLTIVILMV